MIRILALMTILISLTFNQGHAQKLRPEFRGIWVITWEIFRTDRYDESSQLYGDELKERIRIILDNVKKAGLNAVIWQVRQRGESYYRSPFEPWGKYIGRRDPGFDPLSFAITEAKKRDLEFHAWINTFESYSDAPGTPTNKHPEWVCTDEKGNPLPQKFTLSPGIPEVRNYLVEVISDIARRYPVDGIHMDYVRWSEYPMGEGDPPAPSPLYQYDRFHLPSGNVPDGFESWGDWRRNGVTAFVRSLRKALDDIRPGILLTPAAIGKYNWGFWNGRDIVSQDAARWLNEGTIDQIMGMNYVWRTYDRMYDGLTGGCPDCWMDYVIEGTQQGRPYSAGVGSLMMRNRDEWDNHIEVVKAIRDSSWVGGMQFFSYGDWEKKNYFQFARENLFPGNIPETR